MGKKRAEYYHFHGAVIKGKVSAPGEFDHYRLINEMLTLTKNTCSVMAFCLIKDNSHILVKVRRKKQPDLSRSILSVWNTGTGITNINYLKSLIAYIHRVPIQYGITTNFQTYPYTSFTDILYNRKSIVSASDVLKIYGSREIFLATHRKILNGLALEEADCRI